MARAIREIFVITCHLPFIFFKNTKFAEFCKLLCAALARWAKKLGFLRLFEKVFFATCAVAFQN